MIRDSYATSTYELAEAIANKIWPLVTKNAIEFIPGCTSVFWEDIVELIEDALVEGNNQRQLPLMCTAGLIKVHLLLNPAECPEPMVESFTPIPPEYRRPPRVPVPLLSRRRKEEAHERPIA